MRTPADLKLARVRVGATPGDIAMLVKEGKLTGENIRNSERPHTSFVFDSHVKVLARMEEFLKLQIDKALGEDPPEFLFIYQSADELEKYEYEFDIVSVELHTMYIALLQKAWADHGFQITAVYIPEKKYEPWLTEHGRQHSEESRMLWGREYIEHIKQIPE